MKIEVTQEDIDLNGHSCTRCPVKRAVSRHTNLHVEAGGIEFRFYKYKNKLCVGHIYLSYTQIAPKVEKWIHSYDMLEGESKPFSFNLSAECFMV